MVFPPPSHQSNLSQISIKSKLDGIINKIISLDIFLTQLIHPSIIQIAPKYLRFLRMDF